MAKQLVKYNVEFLIVEGGVKYERDSFHEALRAEGSVLLNIVPGTFFVLSPSQVADEMAAFVRDCRVKLWRKHEGTSVALFKNGRGRRSDQAMERRAATDRECMRRSLRVHRALMWMSTSRVRSV